MNKPDSKRCFANYIAGEAVCSEQTVANLNPSDISDCIGHYSQATPQQCHQALDCAAEAQKRWARYNPEGRAQILKKIAHDLHEAAPVIGTTLSREEGKPLNEGIAEIQRAACFFDYYAAETIRNIGDFTDSVRDGIEITMNREPVGVVAMITPWNFPAAVAAWKAAPALAFGNAVIWKPSNTTPATAVEITEIIKQSDLPVGTFQLVMGSGSNVGKQLAQSASIDALSFTGSVEAGRSIAVDCAGNFTKVQLEMGSKNALVITESADLERAVDASMAGSFSSTGQKCTASSRLIVHEDIFDPFVSRLIQKANALKVGHALEAGTQMGPVVSEAQLLSNLAYIELAQREHATVLCGGARVQCEKQGYYMQPTVIADLDPNSRLLQEEMFAPITCIQKYTCLEEAVEWVNNTQYGLTSGIITQKLTEAIHFRRHALTGCVMINLPTSGTDYHVAFGGRKNSSYGPREQGQYAREFYTAVKTTYLRYD